jgi:hypothetical protein
MTSAPAIVRYIACLLLSIACAVCSPPRDAATITAIDLIRLFERAEKRPPSAFAISSRAVAGAARPSIVAPVPSRLVWPLSLPRGAIFRAFVAAEGLAPGAGSPVRLRVGVSDHRIYEGLAEAMLRPGGTWQELRADLSAYAGWKWSLFYTPERVTWRLVLAADATSSSPATVLWGGPEILTDVQGARDYAAQRRN